MINLKSIFLIPVLFMMIFSISNCKKPEDVANPPEPTTIIQTFDLGEGTTTLFEPTEPSNAVINVKSTSNTAVIIQIREIADNNGTIRTLERTLAPGEAFSEEFPQVVAVLAVVPVLSVPVDVNLDFVVVFVPSEEDNGFSISDWLSAGEICMNGQVESEPDQNIDCLWEKETLWQAASERDVELIITLTGDQDMQIDIEGPVGIFQGYNISAPPALPQFRTLSGQWEGVVAVSIHCLKSPVNPCSSCDFTYELCYK